MIKKQSNSILGFESIKNNIKKYSSNELIKLCFYKILNHKNNYFIQYLLFIDINEELDFFTLNNNDNQLFRNITFFDIKVKNMISSNNSDFIVSFDYDSIMLQDNCIFIKINTFTCSKTFNKCCFSLVDEIVNKGFSMFYKIKKEVTDYFWNNKNLMLLVNKSTGNYFDMPCVCYKLFHNNKINLHKNYTIPKTSEISKFGHHYYFYNIVNILSLDDVNPNLTYIRFIVFLGKTLLHYNGNNCDYNNWVLNYDSITVSKYTNIDKVYNYYIVKENSQFKSLNSISFN